MFNQIKAIFKIKTIRNRILFCLAMLIVFRFLSSIPVPGINNLVIENIADSNGLLQAISFISGGGLSTLSILMLGIGPYITASIIIQLLTMVFPRLKEMQQEEGSIGRKRLSNWSRLLSVPLAFLQTFGLVTLISRQTPEVFAGLQVFEYFVISMTVVAGSILLMWIGERVSEYGIGNGATFFVSAGIIASMPQSFARLQETYDSTQLLSLVFIVIVLVAVIAAIVYITEAERPIEINYSRQARSLQTVKSFIPIKLNQAGVMPIIFALVLLSIPGIAASFMISSGVSYIVSIGQFITTNIVNNLFVTGVLQFALVFFFTYFYTALTFNPEQMAENFQKSGTFIPGIRPGDSTIDYLSRIVTRTTFIGAIFLAIIAVLPIIVSGITGISSIAIGGTGMLIIVSSIMDMVKKVNAEIGMTEYGNN